MEETEVIGQVDFIAHGDAPVIMKPGEQPFDFPAPTVSPQWPSVLGGWLLAISHQSVRCNELNVSFGLQPCIEFITVVSLVTDEALRLFLNETAVQCGFDEGHLMWRSTSSPNGDRKTIAVRDCHDLAPFSALCWTNARAPLFAETNVPSM